VLESGRSVAFRSSRSDVARNRGWSVSQKIDRSLLSRERERERERERRREKCLLFRGGARSSRDFSLNNRESSRLANFIALTRRDPFRNKDAAVRFDASAEKNPRRLAPRRLRVAPNETRRGQRRHRRASRRCRHGNTGVTGFRVDRKIFRGDRACLLFSVSLFLSSFGRGRCKVDSRRVVVSHVRRLACDRAIGRENLRRSCP